MRLPHRLTVFAALAALAVAPAYAQNAPPAPSPEVQRLGYWVGTWAVAGENNTTSPASKYTGVLDCKWFTGNAVVICNVEGEVPPEMHIWSYSSQDKAYNWYAVMTTGTSRTVRKVTVDGDKWLCDYETTSQGKPATLHFEWVLVSPTSATYQMYRAVGDSPRTLVYDSKMTKKPKT